MGAPTDVAQAADGAHRARGARPQSISRGEAQPTLGRPHGLPRGTCSQLPVRPLWQTLPCLRSVREPFSRWMHVAAHRSEVKAVLSAVDPVLGKEIEYDLRQFDKAQKQQLMAQQVRVHTFSRATPKSTALSTTNNNLALLSAVRSSPHLRRWKLPNATSKQLPLSPPLLAGQGDAVPPLASHPHRPGRLLQRWQRPRGSLLTRTTLPSRLVSQQESPSSRLSSLQLSRPRSSRICRRRHGASERAALQWLL